MGKAGQRKQKLQLYRCKNGHQFRINHASCWDDSFIEYVVYVYLRCLSLNTAIDIVRATYEKDLLTKSLILQFIEQVADVLPTIDDIDRLYDPVRSGYLAFDGVWFKYGNDQIVLLVCFDPVTFDVVSAIWSDQETREGYERLIRLILKKLPKTRIKGLYGDGDRGLKLALKHYFPLTPFQLCIVHKNLRMQQTIPLKSAIKSRHIPKKLKREILKFADLFHNTLYADTKEQSLKELTKLLHWTDKHPREKFLKAVNQLKRNFRYTLTHFDYPDMERDNNLIECFNGCIKPRLKLMRGFKKKQNLDRYLKLFLLEFRFHTLKESRFKERRSKSPLELGGVYLPKSYNFISFLRKQLKLSFQPTTNH
ncbi:transposase [Patescibacteria group bacterium]|nr:transposase [Patescibacteria group bacterium]